MYKIHNLKLDNNILSNKKYKKIKENDYMIKNVEVECFVEYGSFEEIY